MQTFKFLRPIQNAHDGRVQLSALDVAVYTFVLLMGVFQLTHYPRTSYFLNDTTYPDLARSVLEQGSYQIRFLPETTFPPGFTLILAAVGLLGGITPETLFPVIAVFATLGLLVTYGLLRRVEGRGVAAGTCLLLASSPILFNFNTAIVYPEMPYFMMSMLALFLAFKIDRAERGRTLTSLVLVLSIIIVFAVLIRSVGIALVAGLGTWIAMSLLVVPQVGWHRLRRFAIPLVLGLAAQSGWSVWAQRHQILEWELPGYPRSYISQVRVKDGNHPELGLAHLSDFPARAKRNVLLRAAGLSQFLTRRPISKFWSSPAIFGVLFLVGVGLVSSLRNGGHLYDWYFLWYEIIFMLWPWNYSDRFLIPVVPLACLYLYRGARVVQNYLVCQPRSAGIALIILTALLCICSAAFAFGIFTFPTNPEHVRGDHLQPFAATLFWGILVAIGFGMLKFRSLDDSSSLFVRLGQIFKPGLTLRIAAILVIGLVVLSGTAKVMAMGRNNLSFDITKHPDYPMILAANWIRSNEPLDRVIMAGEPEFIFHFTGRRVVWFPPISDSNVLMDGIRRHRVGVILVVHRSHSYWLPPEEVCFQALQQAHPRAFDLVYTGLDSWVYEVVPRPDEPVAPERLNR
jgi:hypothetical protein